MKPTVHFAILGMLTCMSCFSQTKNSATSDPVSSGKLEKMPEALENRFALSAIPSHLRETATTYVLDPAKGYVLSHKGTNGISCIVVRSDWQWSDDSFRDDIFWAVLRRRRLENPSAGLYLCCRIAGQGHGREAGS